MAKVSVVILNYNGKEYLEQFLPSVITNSKNASIVIIDNGSTDQSLEFLNRNHPEVKVIILETNLGYAGGYNEGLKSISTDYCVLLNSDIEVTPNWIDPIIELMENDERIAACQPKILSYNQRGHFEYAGASGGFIDWLGYPFCRGRIFDTTEEDTGQYDDIKQVFWASGACLFVRTDIFKKFGGFDSSFFAHMEEIDLCWRLQKGNYKVMVCPESTVYHVGGGTLPVTSPRKTYLNFRNSLEMLAKNLSWWKLWYTIPLRWVLDWIAILKFVASGSLDHGLAVLKAHIQYLLRLPGVLKKRSDGSAISSHLVRNRLIVLDYFLKGNKYYHQLKD